jgi:hypothetical protein
MAAALGEVLGFYVVKLRILALMFLDYLQQTVQVGQFLWAFHYQHAPTREVRGGL